MERLDNRGRIVWVDVLKFICIISVMAEHCAFMPDILNSFVEPYFLNGFFFVSGYTYIHRKGFHSFFTKKCQQLLIPWLVFSLFIVTSAQAFSINDSQQSFLSLLGWNLLQIRYYNDEMWFVAALFVAYIPFYFFVDSFQHAKVKNRMGNYILLAWFLSFISALFSNFFPSSLLPWDTRPGLPATLPWHLEYMFQAMFFMALGYFFHGSWESRLDSINSAALCILLFVLYCATITFPNSSNKFVLLAINYVRAFVGVITLIIISKKIHSNRFIAYVGQNTIIFYGLHGKVESAIQVFIRFINPDIYNNLAWADIPFLRFACCVAEAFGVAVLLLIPTWLINHYFPFVAGHTYSRKTSIESTS